MLSACNDKQPLQLNIGSQCNNGIERVRNFDLYQGSPRDNYLTSYVICDYDELGRVILEQHYNLPQWGQDIAAEVSYSYNETNVIIEFQDYIQGVQDKNFVIRRTIIDLM